MTYVVMCICDMTRGSLNMLRDMAHWDYAYMRHNSFRQVIQKGDLGHIR